MKGEKSRLRIENEESEPQSTLELNHIKLFRVLIEIIGSWPHADVGTKKISFFVPNNTVLFVISFVKLIAEVMYLKSSFGVKSFDLVGHVYVTVLVNLTALTRIILPWTKTYRRLLKSFLEEFHLFHFRNKSDYAKKIYVKVTTGCGFFMKLLTWECISGLTTFNLAPCIRNYRNGMFSDNKPANGTYELSVYYASPFKGTTEFNAYVVIATLNIFLSALSSLILIFYDLIIILLAVNIWGHMKILINDLKTFPLPALEDTRKFACPWYTEEESENVKQRLIDIIKRHRSINQFSNKTSDVFGPVLFFYYVILQVSGCIVLFQLSSLDAAALAKYGMVALILFQELILLSAGFELINMVNDTIINEVYALPWECMDNKNRKLVLFFLRNVQEPVSIKAMGMIPVGVETMTAVLKTSISSCVMLRTFAYE